MMTCPMRMLQQSQAGHQRGGAARDTSRALLLQMMTMLAHPQAMLSQFSMHLLQLRAIPSSDGVARERVTRLQ